MKFIVAIPNTKYYLWQALVQINNFKKIGYNNDLIYIVSITNPENNELCKTIFQGTQIKAYAYYDTRESKEYPSSLRLNALKQHFKKYPNKYKNFLYIDPDVIFTKKINFDRFKKDDIWYVSDTKSYICSGYIKSKSEELFKRMCKVVDIEPEIIEHNDENAGGAQYLMKNVDWLFWSKAEKDSENLYKLMKETEKKYSPKHPIQSWTADMWAVLWNALYFNRVVKIDKELDFAWATDHVDKYNKVSIYHNAGVTNQNNFFSKIKFSDNETPFNKNILNNLNKNVCAYKYAEEILDTINNYPNIIF